MRKLYFALFLLLSFKSFTQDPNFHIYLAFGQSNMAGAGDIEAQDLGNVDPRFQFMKPQNCSAQNEYAGQWYTAEPPLWGCTGGLGPSDYFGRTMVQNLPGSIKIGVIVVAIPGCKIELFGKTGYEGLDTYNNVPSQYNGSAYAWLVSLAQQAQQDGVIKGILLHQGESNTGDQQWPNKVKGVYDNLMTDLNLNPAETPLLAGELLYQQYNSCCSGHNNIIRTLPNVIPNAHVISAEGLPGKDVYHFNSAGVREYGVRYAQKMLEVMPTVSPVTVNFTNPANNAVFYEGDDIEFEVTATSTESDVLDVGFYYGDDRQHLDGSPPYTYTIQNASPGTYQVRAIATDENWNFGESTINVRVVVPQEPYGGTSHPIPGTIQLEEYDVGGNDFAYYDDSEGSETGVNYRTDEDVDIENCTDTGGGYNIGWATSGEWLEYTVDVAASGVYDVELRMACNGDGRTVSLSMDGENIATAIAIPNTTGWQNWQTVTVNDVTLMAGEQVLRLTVGETDYVNMNFVKFNLVQEFKQEPYNGTAHNIPGRIEAEEYDLGGEGLGFHEANANGNQGNATFRGDEVDIENTGDTDGQYNIAYTLTGEWLAYTVDVDVSGPYELALRVARDGGNGQLHVEIDGEDLTGTITVPNTGAWQTYQTVTVNDLELTAGEHNLRIVFDSDYMNLNYFEFTNQFIDSDNDGVPDHLDPCKDDPNKINPGICGCGNTEESCLDCSGIPYGDAFFDNCNNCVASEEEACSQDCNGDWGGTAAEDACGTCAGGATGITPVTNSQECIATGFWDTNEAFDLYPNPFQNEITVSCAGTFTYSINDVSGNLIETGVGSEGKGIGSNLSPGMYFITIEQSSGVYTEKIVKR